MKHYFCSLVLVAVMITICCNTYKRQTKNLFADISLSNIEALAEDLEYDLPELVVECNSTNYGKCCELACQTSTFGTPVRFYCTSTEDTNKTCTRTQEMLANIGLNNNNNNNSNNS